MSTPTTTRRPSRASRGAAANGNATVTVITPASGRSVTGDNRTTKTASKSAAAPKTTRTAAARKTTTTPKPASKPAASKITETEGKRLTAAAVARVLGDLVAGWPASKTGVSQPDALRYVANFASYLPGGAWDARLGDRAAAGGRGSGRKIAAPATTTTTPTTTKTRATASKTVKPAGKPATTRKPATRSKINGTA